MQIDFERTGGFMGRKVSLNVNLQDLPQEEAQTLRQLLDEVNFFGLTDELPEEPVPDGFTYSITVTTDKLTHTIRTTDMSASPSLRDLVDHLSTQARSK
jgi:hypothetical protein